MLIGEYVQQFEPGITDANNTANNALVQSKEALDQAKNATAIANEALGQSRASVIELINSVNASTVTLIGNKNDGSQTTTNLPVASELQAGVMNTATYVNLKDLNSRVTSLESNTTTYIVVLPNDNPTQAEILNAYRTAYPLAPNPPLDGTTVIDVDKQLFYRYVKNGTVWIKTSGFNVTPFTNENAGIIKGSTTPGQVQAETDGTGSLVGYDALISSIEQNTTAIGTANTRIGAVETKNTEQDTAITNVSNIANHALAKISIAPGSGDVKINQTRGNGNTDTASIPAVTTSLAGIVTPAMFNQWNSGGEYYKYKATVNLIKNYGDSSVSTIFSINDYRFKLEMYNTSGGTTIYSQLSIDEDYPTHIFVVQDIEFSTGSTIPGDNLIGWAHYGAGGFMITSANGSNNQNSNKVRQITKVQILYQNNIEADIIFILTSNTGSSPQTTSLYIASNKPIVTDITS